MKSKGEKVKLPIYTANDDISGTITVQLKDTKKYEHLGIKCFLIGYLCNLRINSEIFSSKDLCTEFMSLSKEMEPAGILTDNKICKFKFPNFEK
jgi:vacuolar protein sorting-associated protein 26